MTVSQEKTIRPFVFDHSFDSDDQEIELEGAQQKEEEIAPVFTEEEMQKASEESYERGLQSGLEQAQKSMQSKMSASLSSIETTLGHIVEQQNEANKIIARETVDLAVAAVGKLLPQFAEDQGTAEIETFISDIMGRLLEEPKITIVVPEAVAPSIENHLTEQVGRIGFKGTLIVQGDEMLSPSDCRIRWGEGNAERTIEPILREISVLTGSIPKDYSKNEFEVKVDPSTDENKPKTDSADLQTILEEEVSVSSDDAEMTDKSTSEPREINKTDEAETISESKVPDINNTNAEI